MVYLAPWILLKYALGVKDVIIITDQVIVMTAHYKPTCPEGVSMLNFVWSQSMRLLLLRT